MFPCLSQTLRTKLETTLTIIMATAELYNFVRGRNDPVDEPIDLPVEDEAAYIEPAGEGQMGKCSASNSNTATFYIMNHLFNFQ